MELSSYLKKGYTSASNDCKIFKLWEDKKISTRRALELFRINNNVRPDISISHEQFKSFMNGLGYYRGE